MLFLLAMLPNVAAPPAAPPVVNASAAPAACLPAGLSRGATVVVLGMYRSGGPTLPLMLGKYRHPVNAVTVTGRKPGKLVLVLAAYEPTIWNLSSIKGRVKAVIASGYYPQGVTGLAPGTPIRFSSETDEAETSPTCPVIRAAYDETSDILAMAATARRAVGAQPRRFYGGYTVDQFDVDGVYGIDPTAPRPEDIRAAVRVVTEEEPDELSRMKLIAPSERSGMPRRRIEWDGAGRIIREEGGRRPYPSRGTDTASRPPARSRTFASSSFWLALLCLIAFVIWVVRRAARSDDGEPGSASAARDPRWQMPAETLAARSTAPVLPDTFEAHPPSAHLTDLAAIAAITASETLVIALHRYGREVADLPHSALDDDLAAEVEAIVERHFTHAVTRYRQVRPGLDGSDAEHADDTLRRAIERLTERLHELRHAQHRRDVAGIDEAARFIDARHPI